MNRFYPSLGYTDESLRRTLVILLRLEAIHLLTALIASMMPLAWMKEIHRSLGMGELPDGPIIGYLT